MLSQTRQRLFDAWRRKFGRYKIQNPQPNAIAAPYTYYIPTEEFLAALIPGDVVKIVFEGTPISKTYGAERMWVILTDRDDDKLKGTLDNEPFDMPQLKAGDCISFNIRDIIDISWSDEDLKDRGLLRNKTRKYWDRCLVDSVILDADIPVEYIYREEPDMGGKDDKYPDSGWRIRGNLDLMTKEQSETESAEYVALGKVLNADDSWLQLIDEPIGSRFFKNPETQKYEIDTDV